MTADHDWRTTGVCRVDGCERAVHYRAGAGIGRCHEHGIEKFRDAQAAGVVARKQRGTYSHRTPNCETLQARIEHPPAAGTELAEAIARAELSLADHDEETERLVHQLLTGAADARAQLGALRREFEQAQTEATQAILAYNRAKEALRDANATVALAARDETQLREKRSLARASITKRIRELRELDQTRRGRGVPRGNDERSTTDA